MIVFFGSLVVALILVAATLAGMAWMASRSGLIPPLFAGAAPATQNTRYAISTFGITAAESADRSIESVLIYSNDLQPMVVDLDIEPTRSEPKSAGTRIQFAMTG
jgi:hypothetical protein